ncbi:unnamed protein product [Pseudo-nitzschia multistriata]|uniref:Uncharacterized protein n=1 Tax=Pseudo-nitzschia multistriata TaxID=183589 RepID=A0A448YW54_9STRA|nr:unnamed protein product [Pseudo-nitzschia multistriata]
MGAAPEFGTDDSQEPFDSDDADPRPFEDEYEYEHDTDTGDGGKNKDDDHHGGDGSLSGILRPGYSCGSTTLSSLIGLVVAGLAGTLVADAFGMFYVDCFLRAYKLPLRVFGIGSAIFAVINTANDVAGAYFVDWYASKTDKSRDSLVGLSGCLFALSVLLPFFRWEGGGNRRGGNFWDGLHFVGSLSVYDTMFSFNCILQGSIVSDNHSMTQGQRIAFFVCRDLVGILAPLVVTKIGLSLFDVANLRPFRIYLVVLVLASSVLSVVGQGLINQHPKDRPSTAKQRGGTSAKRKGAYRRVDTDGEGGAAVSKDTRVAERGEDDHGSSSSDVDDDGDEGTLRFWQVVRDFASHPNFRYWIAMEMLMEMQNTFVGNFQKTFVDRLLYAGGGGQWSRESCDWMLALLDPSTQVVGLLLFLPVQRYGYARMYSVVFFTNAVLASSLLLWNGASYGDGNAEGEGERTTQALWPVAAYLAASSVLSNAMARTGFGLAMCDMVLEAKHSHVVLQGRTRAPSLAGLFMGVNALFCKPAESVLPILASAFLGDGYNQGTGGDAAHANTVLYRLMVVPPLVCSSLQLLVWSRYSLVPERTERLRKELEECERRRPKQDGAGPTGGEGSFPGFYRDGTDADEAGQRQIEMNALPSRSIGRNGTGTTAHG